VVSSFCLPRKLQSFCQGTTLKQIRYLLINISRATHLKRTLVLKKMNNSNTMKFSVLLFVISKMIRWLWVLLFFFLKFLFYLCCKLYTYTWYIIINVYYLEASKISFFFFFFFFSPSSTVKQCNKSHSVPYEVQPLYYNLF